MCAPAVAELLWYNDCDRIDVNKDSRRYLPQTACYDNIEQLAVKNTDTHFTEVLVL